MQAPNAQGLAGLMSQGRAPQMSPQPQQPMPSPDKASPMAGLGSVEDRVVAYRGNPAPLQQRYAMSQDLLDLLALQKIKSEKENAARQMQLQMAQQQAAQGGEPPTIAAQREKEVMELTKNELARQRGATADQQVAQQQAMAQRMMGGVAAAPGAQSVAQPKMMATGGIVAFSGGGRNLDAARERRRAAQDALYKFGLRQRRDNPEGFRAAQEELRAAEAALKDAEQAYRTEVSAAGLDRPAMSRQDIGAAGRFQRAEDAPAAPAAPDNRALLNQADAALRAQPPAAPRPPAPAGLAGLPATPIPAAPTPAAPAAPAAPTPGTPSDPLAEALRSQSISGMNIDPAQVERERRTEIQGLMEFPEEQARRRAAIDAQRRMYEQDFDPERQRREGIKQFLINAGGRRYGTLAGGARGAMDYDTAQRKAQLERAKGLEDMEQGLFGLRRSAVEKAIASGEKGYEQSSILKRQGMETGRGVYATETQARDNALSREIEKSRIAAQNAANAVQREALSFSQMQGHLNSIVNSRARTVEAIKKRYAPQVGMIEMQLQATPNDKKLLQQLNDLQLRIDAEVDQETKLFDDAMASVESRLYGASGAGTGGYTVRKKEPTR